MFINIVICIVLIMTVLCISTLIFLNIWRRKSNKRLIPTSIDYIYHFTTEENLNSILSSGYINLNNAPKGATFFSIALHDKLAYNGDTYYLHGFSNLSSKHKLKVSKSLEYDKYNRVLKIKYAPGLITNTYTRKYDDCILIESNRNKFYLEELDYDILIC